jgi:uncharacterized protein
VLAPNGSIIPDIAGTLPGEGVYVYGSYDTVKRAVEKKVFDVLGKGEAVITGTDLPEKAEILLKAYCLELLAMTKKCGLLVAGYEKVQALQASNQAALLLRAGDSAFSAREAGRPYNTASRIITLFDSDELSSIIGRPHVVHIALKPGKLTTKLIMAIKRLACYKNEIIVHE